MNKYYFTVGEFCAEGMCRNYIGYGAKFVIVNANTFEDADKKITKYAESIFGKREYEDLWYGEHHWNWEATPHTETLWIDKYWARYDVLSYHCNNASLIFTGETASEDKLKECWNKFLINYPVLEIKENGEIVNIEMPKKSYSYNGKHKENVNIENEVLIDSNTINTYETNNDKEFFNK